MKRVRLPFHTALDATVSYIVGTTREGKDKGKRWRKLGISEGKTGKEKLILKLESPSGRLAGPSQPLLAISWLPSFLALAAR